MQPGFALALLAAVCYLASVTLFIGLHLRPSGYSLLRSAVSDYGVGPTRRAFTLYISVGSAGALALAAALWLSGTPPVPGWLLLVLVAMVVARTGVSLVPTDLEGQRLTARGALHYLFATLNFAAAYVFLRNATPTLAGAPGWEAARPVLLALAWAALPALVANCATLAGPLRRVFGLFERLFILVVALWFLAASGALAFALLPASLV